MSDTDHTEKPHHEVTNANSRWWLRFIGYVKRKIHERRAKKKRETAADRAVRLTTNSTVVMAIFTVVLAFVSIGTLLVLKRQLKEMLDGGADTHALAVAAGNQATWTRNLAGFTQTQSDRTKELAAQMKNQADRTKTIAEQAVVQANANRRLAQNAVDTLANTKQSFRDERRAWIGVQGIADSKGFTLTEPWQVTIVFFNSGRTPAKNVQISGMYLVSPIALSGPTPQNASGLAFRPAQSIAPQGFYRETMGSHPGAEGATDVEISGQKILNSQYQRIKSKQVFLYYYGLLKYDDIGGNSHQTQYCILLADPDTKQAGMCDTFNDLD